MGRRQKVCYTSIFLRFTHSTVRLCIVSSIISFLPFKGCTKQKWGIFLKCNDMNQLTRVLGLILVTFAETPVSLTIAINVVGNIIHFQKKLATKEHNGSYGNHQYL